MDQYLLLRFAHFLGLMLMSAGLIGVFVSDMRSRQMRDLPLFAQAITLIAVFYDGLVVPGALLLLVSGTWLIVGYYGWSFLETPWLAGMVLFVCTRVHRRQHNHAAVFHAHAAAHARCTGRGATDP
jgi:uncharacterized membrane protein